MAFCPDKPFLSPSVAVADRDAVRVGPQNFGRLSLPQDMQFHQI